MQSSIDAEEMPLRVLYLEDDPIDAEALRRALARLRPDLQLRVATAPSEARSALEQTTHESGFDVVVIDISLPEMNGFDFLEAAERDGLRGRRRVVVFTSSEHRLDVQAAARIGVDDYVTKTADPACFEVLVRALDATQRHVADVTTRPAAP